MKIRHRHTREIIFESEHDNMRDTVLTAIKSGSDLSYSNLSSSDLRSSDLSYSNLIGASGNSHEIKSLFISSRYPITYTAEYLQIGCEQHKISEWWDFDDSKISAMASDAVEWWAKYKDFIRSAIELSPATE